MAEHIAFSQEKQVGIISLDRVAAYNALNSSMIEAIHQQLETWRDDNSIHMVVVQSTSDKAFCAGGDLRWFYEHGSKERAIALDFFRREYRLNYFIHQYPKPYVALMDGLTMGGGVGISLHGSHPVASERSVFAMPETAIGLFPDIGGSHLLARCKEGVGIYLGLTGHRISPMDAHALGLVRYVIASSDFPYILQSLIDAPSNIPAHARVDSVLQSYLQPEMVNALPMLFPMIRSIFQHTTIESIMEALAVSSDPHAATTLATLEKKSPTSLKVSLAQLRKAMTLDIAACLEMDYCLVQHFIAGHDLYEGIRALIIDKDQSPRWKPSTIADVSPSIVDAYFIPMEDETLFHSRY